MRSIPPILTPWLSLAGLPGPAPTSVRTRSAGPGVCAASLAALFLVLVAHAPPIAADTNQTKANMLWNIAKFVEWPVLPSDPHAPLVFTILGEDELAAELAGLLSSKSVNGRPVFVRFARRPQDARGSQILYVAASEVPRMGEVLAAVEATAVLTVSEAVGFAAHGGMVGFATQGTRVRFEVNLVHAEKSGLKLSAKLLALAQIVTDSASAP